MKDFFFNYSKIYTCYVILFREDILIFDQFTTRVNIKVLIFQNFGFWFFFLILQNFGFFQKICGA